MPLRVDKQTGDFNSSDAKLVRSLADESSIYLDNARLFEDQHSLLMGLLHSLTSAVDAKDTYTCGHSQRVALLSRHLARPAGLNDADVEAVYVAALLHDVGKIGVPEGVLQKAGKLTDEEFTQMKRHPRIGARILEDVRQLRHVLPGVLHHHRALRRPRLSRWVGGRSYPDDGSHHLPCRFLRCDDLRPHVSKRHAGGHRPGGNPEMLRHAFRSESSPRHSCKPPAMITANCCRTTANKSRKLLQRREGKAA